MVVNAPKSAAPTAFIAVFKASPRGTLKSPFALRLISCVRPPPHPFMTRPKAHPYRCTCGCRTSTDSGPTTGDADRAPRTPPAPEMRVLEIWFDGTESTTITSSIELDHPAFATRRF
jgi:hypothetical protein